MRLTEIEAASIKHIANLFEQNTTRIIRKDFMEHLAISDKEYSVLMKQMEHLGVVEEVDPFPGSSFRRTYLRPSPHATQVAREIEAQHESQTAPDIVDQLSQRARSNPKTAWAIIIFLILSLALPMLNSLFELLPKIYSLLNRLF